MAGVPESAASAYYAPPKKATSSVHGGGAVMKNREMQLPRRGATSKVASRQNRVDIKCRSDGRREEIEWGKRGIRLSLGRRT